MKRFVKKDPIEVLEVELEIEIYPKEEIINSATSILNTQSDEYNSFIDGIIVNFGNAGYELYSDTQYTHPSNNPESNSWYYTFLKIEDQIMIKVIVHVRVSDHPLRDKKSGTARERRTRYLRKISRELKDEYELESMPYAIPVDIILDKKDLAKSYTSALFRLKDRIEEIDEAYQEYVANK